MSDTAARASPRPRRPRGVATARAPAPPARAARGAQASLRFFLQKDPAWEAGSAAKPEPSFSVPPDSTLRAGDLGSRLRRAWDRPRDPEDPAALPAPRRAGPSAARAGPAAERADASEDPAGAQGAGRGRRVRPKAALSGSRPSRVPAFQSLPGRNAGAGPRADAWRRPGRAGPAPSTPAPAPCLKTPRVRSPHRELEYSCGPHPPRSVSAPDPAAGRSTAPVFPQHLRGLCATNPSRCPVDVTTAARFTCSTAGGGCSTLRAPAPTSGLQFPLPLPPLLPSFPVLLCASWSAGCSPGGHAGLPLPLSVPKLIPRRATLSCAPRTSSCTGKCARGSRSPAWRLCHSRRLLSGSFSCLAVPASPSVVLSSVESERLVC